ncbi:hypothetical protein [Variovorax sp. JS1663]|uniref:hypothetical protein n=1 Tax=Variovorax sp. JS1663 TaxID=1851577 RepID=UPI000B342F04|nr:hypothetical protein [Variovorax sp. JS1663]OUM00529.1 hypothetical protein A8M77_20905 [Variovorax sp. JS1663]
MSEAKQPLPAPRLQLRWEANPDQGIYSWLCHYELVLPLDEHDIRREVYDDEGEMTGKVDEMVIAIKPPTKRGGGGVPCASMEGERYFDPPFRDGVHANWDAKHLGNPPIFAIAPDGTAFTKPETPGQQS